MRKTVGPFAGRCIHNCIGIGTAASHRIAQTSLQDNIMIKFLF